MPLALPEAEYNKSNPLKSLAFLRHSSARENYSRIKQYELQTKENNQIRDKQLPSKNLKQNLQQSST
jgi:hypothetical protein